MGFVIKVGIDSVIALGMSAFIAGCWWFAAIRLRRYWFVYGLAIVNTLFLLISGDTIFIAQSSGSLVSLLALLHFRAILAVVEALLFVAFICWLLRLARNTHVP
jgi:hypothetical protein